jgi:hypothetical protein
VEQGLAGPVRIPTKLMRGQIHERYNGC